MSPTLRGSHRPATARPAARLAVQSSVASGERPSRDAVQSKTQARPSGPTPSRNRPRRIGGTSRRLAGPGGEKLHLAPVDAGRRAQRHPGLGPDQAGEAERAHHPHHRPATTIDRPCPSRRQRQDKSPAGGGDPESGGDHDHERQHAEHEQEGEGQAPNRPETPLGAAPLQARRPGTPLTERESVKGPPPPSPPPQQQPVGPSQAARASAGDHRPRAHTRARRS